MGTAPDPGSTPVPPQGSSHGDPYGIPAPSLIRLIAEVNAIWPNRDKRTDGWYRAPRIGISYGHNPDANHRVHARDVDKDGMNPDWVIQHINRTTSGLWYIIWNRQIWSMTHNWKPQAYHGPSPHTDHWHVEIYHTNAAWNYKGGWGLADDVGTATMGDVPPPTQWGDADPLNEMRAVADGFTLAGNDTYNYAGAIAALRR